MSRTKIIIVATIVVVALVALMVHLQSRSLASEYPDSPFDPVGPEYPRFLYVEDVPSDPDQPGWDEFIERQQEMWNYRLEEGAYQRASESEQQAVLALWNHEYVTARRKATDVLQENPDSIPALLAMAGVEAFGQSNLPYALYLIRKARYRLQEMGEDFPFDEDAREWYITVLLQEYSIVELMDRREEQLRCIELLEQMYGPLPWLHIWPLVKLERFDEARAFIDRTLSDGRCRLHALNGRVALEDRMQHRTEAYDAGHQLTADCPTDAVTWHNSALSAYSTFRFDEAEESFLRAADVGGGTQLDGSPYIDLAILYTQQARIPEAFDALKKANRRRARKDAWVRDQESATLAMARAQWMLVIGQTEEAEMFARCAAQTPDRAGTTSIAELDLDFSNNMILLNVLKARLAGMRERDAARTGFTGVVPDTAIRQLELECWWLERELASQLTGRRLVDLVRANTPGGAGFETGVPAWLRHGIAQVVPPGVALEAVRRARQIDDVSETVAYLNAFEAEVQLRLGETEEARRLADAALDQLPEQSEALLRCRVRVIAGEACRQLDDVPAALVHLDPVLRTCPQMLALLQFELPVRIETDGSQAAERLRESLLASPRFDEHAQGFPLRLFATGDELGFELDRLHGARHLSGTTGEQRASEDSAWESVAAVAHCILHERLKQPYVDFSQSDLDSLNGSPSAAQYHDGVNRLLDSL